MVVGIAKLIRSDRIPRPPSLIFNGFASPRSPVRSGPCIPRQNANVTNLPVRSVHNQPLRILFCGADELSITSLEALCRESRESPSNVASIEVVCRPGKSTGRGLKQIRHRALSQLRMLPLLTHFSAHQGCRSEVGPPRLPNQHIYWVEGEPTEI